MNIIKKGIGTLLVMGLVALVISSCNEDDTPNPKGLSEIVFSSFSAEASGDGTLVTVTPVSIGATSYSVDFGEFDDTSDVLTIDEHGGSVTYDYGNEDAEAEYVITVTAQSDEGLAPVTMTDTIDVVHVPEESLTTVPEAPTGTISNVFAMYSDGFEIDGVLMEYRWGELASGGTAVTVNDQNVYSSIPTWF